MRAWWRGVLCGVSLFVGVWAAAQTLPTVKPLMQVKAVTNHVYYVQGLSELGSSANQNFISNASFVVTPAGVVVIDTLGSPEFD
jgi:hypothetical protein